MQDPTHCPKCNSVNIYPDGNLWMCPECSNEWHPSTMAQQMNEEVDAAAAADDGLVRDSNGAVLNDGDSVTVIKELKIKGATSSIKVGTKVRNIRLKDAGDGHDIACKIDGIGSINLKSQFVRKL